jgi:hypothetical protein
VLRKSPERVTSTIFGVILSVMADGKSVGHGKPQNRYFPRINAEILLAYRPAAAVAEEARVVKTLSFGLGGVMFEGEEQLPVGAEYLLDIVFGDNRLELKAKAIYSDPIELNLYRTGFSFIGMSADSRELLTEFFLQEYEKRSPEVP